MKFHDYKDFKKKLTNEKNYQILIFSLNIDQKEKIRSMIFFKNSIINRKNNEIQSYIRYERLYSMCHV